MENAKFSFNFPATASVYGKLKHSARFLLTRLFILPDRVKPSPMLMVVFSWGKKLKADTKKTDNYVS